MQLCQEPCRPPSVCFNRAQKHCVSLVVCVILEHCFDNWLQLLVFKQLGRNSIKKLAVVAKMSPQK